MQGRRAAPAAGSIEPVRAFLALRDMAAVPFLVAALAGYLAGMVSARSRRRPPEVAVPIVVRELDGERRERR